ncbi:endonuclease NucS domain-containing protein [Bacillus sp. NPDC094106]|uniref:endonuclease NucS domain-containing protein n=1 Tax=Bacillus sp. NPDC094106 TaxID=3363949 RepID=UPI00382C73BF
MSYYEDEISFLIKNELGEMYGIDDFETLYRYVFLRYTCSRMDVSKKNKNDFLHKSNFIKFLLSELGLVIREGFIRYKGEDISTQPIIGECFSNIIEDWCFVSTLKPVMNQEGKLQDVHQYLNETISCIKKEAKKHCKKYRREVNYWHRVKYESLLLLNQLFGVYISNPDKIEGFYYDSENHVHESLEGMYKRCIASSSQMSTNIELITEEMLELYMKQNLSLIEKGLRLVSTQYMLPKGRIDILARDISGTYVVIELKVAEDTDIVWQSMYYRNEIKKMKRVNDVRFITLMPKCEYHIFESLQLVGGVEIFEYVPVIQNEQLINVQLKKKKNCTRSIA